MRGGYRVQQLGLLVQSRAQLLQLLCQLSTQIGLGWPLARQLSVLLSRSNGNRGLVSMACRMSFGTQATAYLTLFGVQFLERKHQTAGDLILELGALVLQRYNGLVLQAAHLLLQLLHCILPKLPPKAVSPASHYRHHHHQRRTTCSLSASVDRNDPLCSAVVRRACAVDRLFCSRSNLGQMPGRERSV